jgi:hypothetical protein
LIDLLFWMLTILSCSYAGLQGGRDGRRAAVMIVGAATLTIPASYIGGYFGRLEPAVLAVDVALLVGLYLLAIYSRRWWPIWASGFHCLAVLSHLSAAIVTGFVADVYFAASSCWAIPTLVSIVAGIWLDRRAELFPD